MKTWKWVVVGLAILGAAASANAENITGADQIVCSAGTVIVCLDDGTCADGPPWTLNIPHFITVDVGKKKLQTTEASGQKRVTSIQSVQRTEGFLVLQGYENQRAFNWMITEDTGMATVTISLDGMSITAFGVCTPKALK